jgi:hypothetical protein
MAPDQPLRWRKSRRSGGNGGQCVEIAHTLGAVRDSKNSDGPILRAELGALLGAVKAGRIG